MSFFIKTNEIYFLFYIDFSTTLIFKMCLLIIKQQMRGKTHEKIFN